ncbi:fluoride efflux transporter FluC [Leuconostoc gasicomitatum]|uniref:fluoride efflux transporter FluC n=1 Tax=Leuconostoc gasicomitatum TaxID=115778 RepID=UPI001CC33ABB|nr:CrcB family protein [Leuconostoc gasicomitatum]MBZ5961309.1 CrcB family protein [Leuconostoc gasicomitatum]MBZ5969246.1 CrcB family protein [Leuconostoc gasicomitatum]MBZ5984651.1 CrcB family protein [Leuconostoc gasicomitatum]MBZ5994176.1 CrcB family protein [Leuconostoc gasicomitatum]MBZ5998733.1 CrcB family protein [Leuconostoc gasicomitatum]
MERQHNFLIELVIVGLGGGIGGSMRYMLSLIPIIGHMFLITMVINWLGALLLAIFGVYISQVSKQLSLWPPFIGTGILGGFTTFSAMILQINQSASHNYLIAGGYVFFTIFGGIIMVNIGRKIGKQFDEVIK